MKTFFSFLSFFDWIMVEVCRVDVRWVRVRVSPCAIVETSASIYRRLSVYCVSILLSDILGKWNQNFTLHKLGSMMWLCAARSVIMVYLRHIENRSTLKLTDSITQRQPKRFINVNEIGLCNGQIECEVFKVWCAIGKSIGWHLVLPIVFSSVFFTSTSLSFFSAWW